MSLTLFDFDFDPALTPAPKAPLPPPGDKKVAVPVKSAVPRTVPTRPVFVAALFAFVAAARFHGHTDPALELYTMRIGSRAREYDVREMSRFANELLTGIRSDKPTMTPKRWGMAAMKVLEMAGRKLIQDKTLEDLALERRARAKHHDAKIRAVGIPCPECKDQLVFTESGEWHCLSRCGEGVN